MENSKWQILQLGLYSKKTGDSGGCPAGVDCEGTGLYAGGRYLLCYRKRILQPVQKSKNPHRKQHGCSGLRRGTHEGVINQWKEKWIMFIWTEMNRFWSKQYRKRRKRLLWSSMWDTERKRSSPRRK